MVITKETRYPLSMKLRELTAVAVSIYGLAMPASAADDPSSKALTIILSPILDILKVKPDSASDACIATLKELRQTQKALSSGRYDDNPSDFAIAHDVLESDFENAIQICGADARRLCRDETPVNKSLGAICETFARRHPA
ncbi:hypothetical protein [Sorlinia euscelidii]